MKNLVFLALLVFGAYQFLIRPPGISAREIDPSCDVVVFTTATCPYCKKARDFLNAENVLWCEKDIEKGDQNRALFEELGGQGVPYALFGGNIVDGVSRELYQKQMGELF